MALVEGEQSAGAEAVRQHDDREVGETDLQIVVAAVEVQDDAVLFPAEARHLQTAVGDITHEAPRGVPTTAAPQQVVDLD